MRLTPGEVKRILRTPILKRELMMRTIIATQAREGIVTTREQAARAYDKVQEERRAQVQAELGS